MRRRVGLLSVCGLIVQLLVPSTAHAWWGWLDELSGPGPFRGIQFDARLACFGDQPRDRGESFFREGVRELTEAIAAGSMTPQFEAEAARRGLGSGASGNLLTFMAAQPSAASATILKALATAIDSAGNQSASLDAAIVHFGEAARWLSSPPNTLSAGGVSYSACGPERDARRRIAVEVTSRLFHSTSSQDGAWAGGNEIRFSSLTPSLSWRPLLDVTERYGDILDVSSGAGVYWFSSTGNPGGFDSFSGVVLEPLTVGVRPGVLFRTKNDKAGSVSAALKSTFSFRAGLLIFPGGFKERAFSPTVDPLLVEQGRRLPAEKVKTMAVFVDVQPLLYALHRKHIMN